MSETQKATKLTQFNEEDLDDIAPRFLTAGTGQEVEDLILRLEDSDFIELDWKPIGEKENNSGIIEDQKGTPEGGLAECIVNGFDAVFEQEYKLKFGAEYNPAHDIDTYQEAAKKLLEQTGDDRNHHIRMIADGNKPNDVGHRDGRPSLTVMDTGAGRPRSEFEKKFLNLLEAGNEKRQWPFMQGQFGMGSHGVLRFCGSSKEKLEGHGYKLIVSASFRDSENWAWSLIRRNPDKPQTFEYLYINGEIPGFTGQLQVPTSQREGGSYSLSSGTVVKMYDYQVDRGAEVTNATALLGYLERKLLKLPFPLELIELRYEREALPRKRETEGLHKELDYGEANIVQKYWQVTKEHDSEELDDHDIHVYLFHDRATVEKDEEIPINDYRRFVEGHSNRALTLEVNGEAHSSFRASSLKYNCDLNETASDLFVSADLSNLSKKSLQQIFDSSRDSQSSSKKADKLREGIYDAVGSIEPLRDIERERRNTEVMESQSERIANIAENIVQRNPDIAEILTEGEIAGGFGGLLSSGRKAKTESQEPLEEPEGPPTDITAIKMYKSAQDYTTHESRVPYEHEQPVNRAIYPRYEIDAPNDYFNEDAGECSGELKIEPSEMAERVQQFGLENGILKLTVSPPEDKEERTTIPLVVIVRRENDSEELEETVIISHVDPMDQNYRSSDQETNDEGDEDDSSTDGSELGLPEFRKARGQEDLVEFDRDEDTLMAVSIDITYPAMQEFLQRHNWKEQGKERITKSWVQGLGLIATIMYYRSIDDYDDQAQAQREVQSQIRGVGDVLLELLFDEEDISDMANWA